MSVMQNRLLPALPILLLAVTAGTGAAQTPLQLRWELVADSQAAFTLTNRGTKPLPPSGWAIYFSALHSAQPGSVGAGFDFQNVLGDLHRLVPGAGFAGLAPGATIRISYVTDPLLNRSFVPSGPYIVFDAAKDVGIPLSDYVAAPFDRRIATPENQFTLDSMTRVISTKELPPIFPTPVQVTKGTGELRLTAMAQVTASADLANEAKVLSKAQRWEELPGLISDDVLHQFVVVTDGAESLGLFQILRAVKDFNVTVQILLQKPSRVTNLAEGDRVLTHPAVNRRLGYAEVVGGFLNRVPAGLDRSFFHIRIFSLIKSSCN